MRRSSYAQALNEVLQPLGFHRKGDDWIRIRGGIWECVNRQSSWLGGVTVNLFAKDVETEKLYLEIFGSEGAVQIPAVGVPIGSLLDGCSRWWKNDEANGPRELSEAVLEVGVPWFNRVRTLDEQAEQWFGHSDALTSRGYHGPSLVGLALTLHRMGEAEEAIRILSKPVPRTAIQKSVEDVAKVRDWLARQVP